MYKVRFVLSKQRLFQLHLITKHYNAHAKFLLESNNALLKQDIDERQLTRSLETTSFSLCHYCS